MRVDGGGRVRQPPTRPGRRFDLDPVRDRLAYRVAPLGLIERSAMVQLRLRYADDLSIGEDLQFSLPLWFSGRPLVYARRAPRYMLGDAGNRTTHQVRPIRIELSSLVKAVNSDLFDGLSFIERSAVATKMLRGQVFSAVHNRPTVESWTPQERYDLREIGQALLAFAPGAETPLSVADRRLLDAILEPDRIDAATLIRRAWSRRQFGTPSTLVPRDLRRMFHREAPLRFMIASACT